MPRKTKYKAGSEPAIERNRRKSERQKLSKKMRGGSPENKMLKRDLKTKGESNHGNR